MLETNESPTIRKKLCSQIAFLQKQQERNPKNRPLRHSTIETDNFTEGIA